MLTTMSAGGDVPSDKKRVAKEVSHKGVIGPLLRGMKRETGTVLDLQSRFTDLKH